MNLGAKLEFALQKDDRRTSPENLFEKVGNLMSWGVYELPSKLEPLLTDPRTYIVAATVATLAFNTFVFYPDVTITWLERAIPWVIRNIPWQHMRLAAWASAQITTLGIGLRAFGRVSNSALMAEACQ